MHTRSRVLLVAGSLVLTGMTLGACGSDSLADRHRQFRMNPTPELATLTHRRADRDNIGAIMWSENTRMIESDFGRAFYLDRPSRLTREPIPH